MRKNYLFTVVMVIILALFLSSSVNAQFGKFKKLLPKKDEEAKGHDVDQVLERVKCTKESFQGATNCVMLGRDVLFDIAATDEKKTQLQAKEEELAKAGSEADKEKITIEINQMKDAEIDRANKEGELEKKKLNKKQLSNTGNLIWNMLLSVVLDNEAVENGPKIIEDGKAAIENAKQDKMAAAKNATKIDELSTALTKDIPEIIKEAPKQVKTLNAFLSAANSLRKANDIKDLGVPTKGDKFKEADF